MYVIKHRRIGDGRPWIEIPVQSKVTAEFGGSHALFICAHMAKWPGVHSVLVYNEDDPDQAFVIHLPETPV
jgi:hypothetical protein